MPTKADALIFLMLCCFVMLVICATTLHEILTAVAHIEGVMMTRTQ